MVALCEVALSDASDLLAEEMKIGMEFYIHYMPIFCDFTKFELKNAKFIMIVLS